MDPTNGAVTTPNELRATLPTVRTSFIGRERELAAVRQRLLASRLVTLTGAAGCGKTRLALRLASEVHGHYEDVHWVDLARLGEPALVPEVVAGAVHVAEQPGRTAVEGLVEALQDKRLLLVLDNCEHVLSACADLVDNLLSATGICVLATSREPLGVAGEMRYPLSPMAVPPPRALPLRSLEQFDAIQLFVERARAILPDFALNADNAAVVARVCRRLDGLALAIELASARVNVLTVEEIANRLDDRLEVLPAASHLAHDHHRSVRAAIDWSYDLLSAPEQLLLRRLSVLAGGWSLATAEAVCVGDGIEREQILKLLPALVNKSLVVAQTLHRGEARYALLETIRKYARDKLAATDEWSPLHDRHLRCFLRLAEEAEPKLSGPYQRLWLHWLEGEHANIRAALSWALEHQHVEAGLRIVGALYQYWTIRDYVQEGLRWLSQLLDQADEDVAPVVRAQALAYAAFMAGFRGKTAEQMQYGHEAAALAEAAGAEGKLALTWALGALAHGARGAGDFETEFSIAKRVIQLRRELGDSYFLGLVLTLHSPAAMALGKYEEARAMLGEGLALLRQAENPYRIAMALNYLGDLARCERKYAQACAAYEACVSSLREISASRDLASALHNWGHACLHLGDVERAQALFRESLALQQARRNTAGIAECLIGFAALAIVQGLPGTGARLLGAAEAIGGPRIASAWAATRMEYDHYLARAHASLTETELQAEQAAGCAMSCEQAVQYAVRLPLEAGTSSVARRQPDDLTIREREVAALVARGRSNGEIAGELVLSKRTVEKHIANILAKREFTNRAQIVRWALGAGLARPTE